MASLFSYPKFHGEDSSGNPLVGGKLYTYSPGTTTPKVSYTTASMSVPNTNPVILNSNGDAVVYLNGLYDVVLKDSAGVTQWSMSNVNGINAYTSYEVDALNDYGSGTSYTQATIEAALTAIGTAKATLLLRPGTWEITGNLTIPTNVALKVPTGVIFQVTTGMTLMITGPFEAGLYQVFSGAGRIAFGSEAVTAILPEWRGAVSDNSTDSYSMIAAIFLDAAASKTASFKPTVYFSNGTYLTSGALSCAAGINIDQHGSISYSGIGNIAILTVGTAGAYNSNVKLTLDVTRSTNSDWTSEDSISIRLQNIYSSRIEINKADNSTIGLQLYSQSSAYGIAHNELTLNYLMNNKVQLDLAGDGTGGWVNENIFIGGRFEISTGVNNGSSRYGVRFQSLGSSYNHNNNLFLKPCFQLGVTGAAPGEAIPVLIETGDYNRFLHTRLETNSATAVRAEGTSQGNELEAGYWDNGYAVEDDGSYAGTRLYSVRGDKKKRDALISVFNSGFLPDKALTSFSVSTYTHIAGMFQAATGDSVIYPAIAGGGAKVVGNSYVGFIATETSYALGVVVDTSVAKQFYLHTTVLTTQYARHIIKCYDSMGTLLTSVGAGHPYVKNVVSGNNFTYNTIFGGGYLTAGVSAATGFVVGDDVKSIRVLVRGETNLQLTGIEILANEPCHVTAGYGESLGESLAYASPTKSLVSVRRHAYHANPAASTTPGWVCTQRWDTTVKTNVSSGTSVDTVGNTSNLAAGDVVGIVLDSGAVHWSTVSSITDADTIVIADAVPSLATAGNIIYTMRWKAMANLAA